MLALTFNTSLQMRTVPVGITLYQGEYAFPWAIISSAIMLGVLPLVRADYLFSAADYQRADGGRRQRLGSWVKPLKSDSENALQA